MKLSKLERQAVILVLAAWALGFFALCCFLFVIAPSFGNRPTRTAVQPTSTVPPKPTQAMPPTWTPTSAGPTDTPPPANTPKPANTPTPVPKVDAAETEYLLAMTVILDSYGEAFGDFAELSDAAADDPTLMFFDEVWRFDVALVLVTIQINGEAIRELEPPPRFVSIHGDLLEAVEHYDTGVDLFAKGIDEMDVDILEKALLEFLLGNAALEKASEKAEKLAGK